MWPVVKNNLRLTLASKGTLFMLLALPLIVFSLGLFNSGSGSSGVFSVRLGVYDSDQSALSLALTDALDSEYVAVVPTGGEEPDRLLVKGRIDAALLVEKGYEDALLAGRKPTLTLRSIKGREATALAEAQLNLYVSDLLRLKEIEGADSADALLTALRALDDTALSFGQEEVTYRRDSDRLAPAQGYLLFAFSLSMLQVSGLILREKQWNTLHRILCAPIARGRYILANVLTGLLFLTANLLSLWGLTAALRIPVPPVQYLVWLLYGLVWIAAGLFLALAARSKQGYNTMTPILTTIFAMLGGCYWPLWLVPPFMRALARITPQYWAHTLGSLALQGKGIGDTWPLWLALLGFLCLFSALCAAALSKRKSNETFL